MTTSLVTVQTLNALIVSAKKQGCTVDRDNKLGTAVVKDREGEECLRAIQKNRGGDWIATVGNTDLIQWSKA